MGRTGFELRTSAGLPLYLAALLLLLPLRWVLAALSAAAVHELFHIAALLLLGHPVRAMKVGLFGARIVTEPLPEGHELICALAGPLGGLALLGLAKWLPAVSVCALFQSLYNLLPIFPADGGRALRCGVRLFFPGRIGERVAEGLEILTLSGILAVGILGSFFLKLGPVPILAALCMVFPAVKKK